MEEPRHTSDLKAGVDLQKKTTKVNLWIVIGVVTFLAVATFMVWRIASNPPQTTQEMQERSGTVPP